jgi:lysozyme
MKLGARGEELIKSYETLRLVAYLPTPDDIPTIGWGHTRGVKLGDTCTIEQAQKWFEDDTASAVNSVNRVIAFSPHMSGSTSALKLTQSAFDALVSLVFNVGASCISASSTIGRALRRGDLFGAWAGFALWRKQGKKDLQGLARRRAKEMMLFMEDSMR